MAGNPFRPYPKGKGPIKLFVFGDPGTLKTRRAMTLPGPRFMVDMEKGADEYGDLAGDGDQYMACASLAALMEALDYLDTLKPSAVGTLIVDPITVLWDAMQSGQAEKIAKKRKCSLDDALLDKGAWGRIKRVHGDVMTRLVNAPYHVVMIARGKVLKDDNGNVTGYGYDGNKQLDFLAKTVVITRGDHDFVVKDRSGTWKERTQHGTRLDFRDLLTNSGKGGARLETATEAAQRDAAEPPKPGHDPSWEADRAKFCAELGRMEMDYDVVAAVCLAMDPPRPRPSGMTLDQRRGLLSWLRGDDGRARYRAAKDTADAQALDSDPPSAA